MSEHQINQIVEINIHPESDWYDEIIHNHIDCPVCLDDYAPTDAYCPIKINDNVKCMSCNTVFRIIDEFNAEIISFRTMEKETKQQIIQHLMFGASVKDLNIDYVFTGNIHVIVQFEVKTRFYNPKLLLRPLIELYQNTHCLIDYLGTDMCEAYEEWISSFNNDSERIYTSIKQAPYEIVIWCLENHFDVFGLIEKGYAEELI